MDFLNLQNFFADFGVTTVIIAIIVCISDKLTDKFLKDKYPVKIKNLMPLVLSLVLELSYDMIFVSHAFVITESGICAGILTYSLSTVISVMINKIKRGENITLDLITLLVEGLLDGYVNEKDKSQIALTVASIIKERDLVESKKKELIKQKILDEKSYDIKDSEVTHLVDSIICQTNNMEKKDK